MSDERSSGPSTADEADAADADSDDALEPGGGPQRVVSEESVDDILESLDSARSAADSSDDTTASESVTTEFDEDDVPTTDPATAEPTSEPSAGEGRDSTPADAAESEPTSIDAAAASIPDDADLEDLAARVETGDVTGADVRAAEAGEGRESTPEIDDVDLSMDDLETGAAPGSTDDDWPDDAGPLAGSVDRDGNGGGDDASDDSPGLLGRLKRFFSP
ncbi:hypothetical protein A6E15_04600 [Natrinema saccharevitans]|uniref:Uncharacterized protein n=1 Tax=Natrinema saccharevitans TaxID=301967 RepID=A0A1S8AUG2_9EURY|nr:hypothetical protein [Natrinema saccharevitans]OLZ40305.1 hypothetical protein A6E15_04600 [Natrinema saccharevitans]